MKKIFIPCLMSIASLAMTTGCFATDLVDVYQQAVKSDPAFKAANSQWLAARENLPISRASLMPQLMASGGVARAYNNMEYGAKNAPRSKYYSNQTNYSLNLTQSLFNFAQWSVVREANAAVKQAQADFASAGQDLMYRVASAYFQVLLAQDVLTWTIEQKKAVYEQLRQQKQRYEVGLIPITDVNDAQASYDSTVADEISAKNEVQDAHERLQEIVGIKYADLAILQDNIPLVSPSPQNIEQWVQMAERQNTALLAAQYAAMAAREDVSVQGAGHLPTLSAGGGVGYNYGNNTNGNGAFTRARESSVGLSVNVPLFQGGLVSAKTQQAGYKYQVAIAEQEKMHRSVVSGTRQAYLGVLSGISKIKADRQSVKSKIGALQSTSNSYSAGMRTMVDVLKAQSEFYNAQKNYAKDQYDYILQTLTLKQNSGSLNIADLESINKWLTHERRNTQMPKLALNNIDESLDVADATNVNDKMDDQSSGAGEKQKVLKEKDKDKDAINNAANAVAPTTLPTPVSGGEQLPAVSQLQAAPVTITPPVSSITNQAPVSAKAATVQTSSAVPITKVDNSATSLANPVAAPINPEIMQINPAIAAAAATLPITPVLIEPTRINSENIEYSSQATIDSIIKTNDVSPVNAIESSTDGLAKTKAKKAAPKHLTYAEKYFHHAQPQHYTLILMSADEQQELINFAAKHNLQKQTVLYSHHANGKNVYSLIYGDYDAEAQARTALKKLSHDIQDNGTVKITRFAEIIQDLSSADL